MAVHYLVSSEPVNPHFYNGPIRRWSYVVKQEYPFSLQELILNELER